MKKTAVGLLVLVLLLFPSREAAEVGRLEPVQLLYLYREGDRLILAGDTGSRGEGATLAEAVKDLKQTAPGTLFLETADFLVVTGDTETLLPEMGIWLRPSAEAVVTEDPLDPGMAAEYLSAHPPEMTLHQIRTAGGTLPKLSCREARFHLEKP